jgi:hypothetical protein
MLLGVGATWGKFTVWLLIVSINPPSLLGNICSKIPGLVSYCGKEDGAISEAVVLGGSAAAFAGAFFFIKK